jgi:hypothetical protein
MRNVRVAERVFVLDEHAAPVAVTVTSWTPARSLNGM